MRQEFDIPSPFWEEMPTPLPLSPLWGEMP